MNFGNDFGPGSSLAGWECIPSAAPGAFVPIDPYFGEANGNLVKFGGGTAIAVYPATVVGTDGYIEARVIKAMLQPSMEAGIFARLTTTDGFLFKTSIDSGDLVL